MKKAIVFIMVFLGYLTSGRTQSIGSFPWIDGGFENQTYGGLSVIGTSIANGVQYSNYTTSVIGSSGFINNVGGRSGSKYLTWTTSSSSNILFSPTASSGSNAITNATSYVVQLYYKYPGTGTSARAFNIAISPDGTGSFGSNSTTATLNATAWTKVTAIVTSGSSANTTKYGLIQIVPSGGSFTNPYSFDDIVIYAGSSADTVAPGPPTAPIVASATNASLTVGWTAPSGGVDGGGYIVVRGTTDPATAPLVNGVYGLGNSIGTGTVVYNGTATSFVDSTLLPGTKYYYRIYTGDKAFNYSSAITINGTTTNTAPTCTCNLQQVTHTGNSTTDSIYVNRILGIGDTTGSLGIHIFSPDTSSITVGYQNSTTIGKKSYALGYNNSVSAKNSVAIGSNINNSTDTSIMIGTSDSTKFIIDKSGNTMVNGKAIINNVPNATTNDSIVVWNSATHELRKTAASNISSAVPTLQQVTTVGNTTTNTINANQIYSVGDTTNSLGIHIYHLDTASVVIGYKYGTIGHKSFVVGYNNNVPDSFSSVFGQNNTVSSHTPSTSVFGKENLVSGYSSIALGRGNSTDSTAKSSSAIGYKNHTSGEASSAFGYENTSDNIESIAFGYKNNNTATYHNAGYSSVAVGHSNAAPGGTSSSIGILNVVTGNNSSAFGYNNNTYGNNASAFGYKNFASAKNSSAFGYRNHAFSDSSSAFGYQTVASQNGASVFGSNIHNGIANSVMVGSSDSAKITILSNGNVGIGTTNPTEMLSINGNIMTKKVIVTQSGWSDYVFDSAYKLRSLSEVELFIKNNKHLPEIPSANQVEKNGLNLGDNQALLLKKVEELTLYMINQQKRIEELSTQNEEISKENKHQQHEIDELKKNLHKN